jgi:outer membrane protein assembly factor BamD (BamD/ComL family)
VRPTTTTILAIAALALAPRAALAQPSEFELDDSGTFAQTSAPEPGSDAWVMAEAQRLIAEDNPGKASSILKEWIDEHKRQRNDTLPQAYYLRGIARTENGDEYKALFDFETVIRDYAETPYYQLAIEREYDTAMRYLNDGLKRKVFGLRIESGRPTGVEILIRVQERLPGSALAERAALDLANYYYQRRDLKLAAQMYEIFRTNFPESDQTRFAMLREIECNIARFKGPRYDGSGLLDAKLLIEEYRERFPAESIRAGITEGLEAWIDESAAQQALDTARWYLKTDDPTSAKFILARLIRRHPATLAADEALDLMLEEGWLTFGEQREAEPDA